ncbi:hypothetical protein CVT26_008515 [Gymnopilus dilepis]|uniref:DNA replication complex GINS protein PSF3 n=1 Tax=Gymnopilus dilepis TaxID=231916 RepID=A0A409XXJ8_9AGAR|nr:hypothetical protein CVT26_008515 [Gymnopilus dilepis]
MDYDYFSVEAILAENQKIQCTFKHAIPGMGHLGGGSERDIAVLSKMQIPIWLAYTIIYSDWAEFNIPQPFSSRVRNALRADACSVRLSNLVGAGGSWYGFGKTIMDILSDEQANEMSQMLTKAFRERLVDVIDQAQHFAALGQANAGGTSGNAAQSFREGLDTTERELFSLAQESAKQIKRWYEDSDRAKH